MKCITVELGERSYKISIGRGLLNGVGSLAGEVADGGLVALVTDSNVRPLYAEGVKNSLEAQGFKTRIIEIPAGEEHKNIGTLDYIYNELTNCNITRSDTLLALGGGVAGDVAGFAAATILRGIRLIQVPTTLLAQVDSAVGGKNAINLKNGKNLVGTIYQPSLVVVDPDTLTTLNRREFACGMAEVIKYGLIKDRILFELLEGGAVDAHSAELEDIIYSCCDIKRRLVEADEHDRGERMLLNFGHTLGHVYEKAYAYKKYTHGEAVAAGMAAIARLGLVFGMNGEILGRIIAVLRKYSLPESIAADADEYRRALALDKKSSGSTQRVVLLHEIGNAYVKNINKDEMLRLIQEELT